MNRRVVQILVPLLITCGILALLFHGTDAPTPRLRGAELTWMLVATAFYAFCVVCRGLRMILMENQARNEKVGALNIVAMTTVHTAVNQLAPLRLGELTYAGLMKQRGGNFGAGLGVTLRMRIADLVGLGLVTTACAFAVDTLPSGVRPALIGTGIALSVASSWVLLFGSDRLAPWLRNRYRDETRWSHRAISSLAQGIQQDHDTRRLRVQILLSTLALWSGIILVHWAIGRAFGLTLSPWQMGIVALGSIVLTFLPVATLGNFGTSEGGFILGFALLQPSLPRAKALEIGLNIHIGLLFIVVCFGALALVFLRAKRAENA